ncbi:MAG: hypothetical protein ACM3NH_04395 [Candidatus Saccharibacteria bacterium]
MFDFRLNCATDYGDDRIPRGMFSENFYNHSDDEAVREAEEILERLRLIYPHDARRGSGRIVSAKLYKWDWEKKEWVLLRTLYEDPRETARMYPL